MKNRILIIAIALWTSGRLFALPVSKLQDFNSSDKIQIINETGENQEFWIGENLKDAALFTIGKDEKWNSPSYTRHPYVRIYTEKQYEEYFITPGKKYILYWDEHKKHVDIKAIREKQGNRQ